MPSVFSGVSAGGDSMRVTILIESCDTWSSDTDEREDTSSPLDHIAKEDTWEFTTVAGLMSRYRFQIL